MHMVLCRSRPTPSWEYNIHDFGGGDNDVGPSPQNGQDNLEKELTTLMVADGCAQTWDDVNGNELDAELVKQARVAEMEYFEKLGVYERVDRSHQKSTNGNIITTMWLAVNKGDAQCPEYRSRIAGRETRRGVDDSLYAATPPLEALRATISHAAIHRPDWTTHQRRGRLTRIMVNDVRRACLMPPHRWICILSYLLKIHWHTLG